MAARTEMGQARHPFSAELNPNLAATARPILLLLFISSSLHCAGGICQTLRKEAPSPEELNQADK